MIARPQLALAVAALLTTACSLGLSSPSAPDQELTCETSMARPAVDGVLTGALGLVGVFAGLTVVADSGWGGVRNPSDPECQGCGYVAIAALASTAAFAASSADGRSKVNACRAERDRRDRVAHTVEAWRAFAAPTNDGPFSCTVVAAQPDVGACSRTRDGCDAHQAALLDRGVFVQPCVGRDTAACFTAVRAADATAIELCFPTPTSCATQGALKRAGTVYREVSACAVNR